jgi:hypothetical protein
MSEAELVRGLHRPGDRAPCIDRPSELLALAVLSDNFACSLAEFTFAQRGIAKFRIGFVEIHGATVSLLHQREQVIDL